MPPEPLPTSTGSLSPSWAMVPDMGAELDAVVVTREAQAEMLERVVGVLRRLPSKGKYPPDQIVDILMREFGDGDV